MAYVPVSSIPRLHETPLASIQTRDARIIVSLDDENENTFRLVFTTWQAMKLITADCYRFPEYPVPESRTVLEVLESAWIRELKKRLEQTDETATFMDKARHFVVPLQDQYLEVVAFDVRVMQGSE